MSEKHTFFDNEVHSAFDDVKVSFLDRIDDENTSKVIEWLRTIKDNIYRQDDEG